jgi:ubiquinone/menaquinone biosynthesis C-methylase UbiE
MPDPYASIAEADPQVQERLADVLELRAADPQQRAMLDSYLAEIDFPQRAQVLEIGCGTGAVSRVLARRQGVGKVIGVDLGSIFLAKARELSSGFSNLQFEQADGRSLKYEDGVFDVVVMHTLLCHVPGPERTLAEAYRVLRPGGWLSIFDGDYVTTTVAIEDNDPLQSCAEAAIAWLVHDKWLFRRLPALIRSAGFQSARTRSHGYLETSNPSYMLTLVESGADFLSAAGRIGSDAATALKAEARRRADADQFFGHIAYVNLIARKPSRTNAA